MQLFKAGAFATDTITDLIPLYAKFTTTGNVSHLRPAWSTSGYQVTAGKTLYIVRIKIEANGNGFYLKMGYADNDVGYDTATARTNGVMALGTDDTGANGISTPVTTGESFNATPGGDWIWKLAPATKYPFLRAIFTTGTDHHVKVWAIEV